MSKVEEYIQNCTRRCSTEIVYEHIPGMSATYPNLTKEYVPWLTPEDAKEVAQIAREEVIEKVCNFIENRSYDYLEFGEAGFGASFDYVKMIEDLKKVL